MTVYIDADGCPVTRLAVSISKRYNLSCTIVCDSAHCFETDYAKVIVTSTGADSVDYKITNMLRHGDIVVTQDYGLAAMSLSRGAYPINQNGIIFTDDNIDAFLNSRALYAKIRRSGGRHKGPPKRTEKENAEFEKSFCELIESLLL